MQASQIQEKLLKYEALIIKWNKAYNLLARSETNHIWKRHIEDSTQLQKYIPTKAILIADLGSGAGLPAIPLSLLFSDKDFYLFESNNKKAAFLENCVRELGLKNVFIKNKRIEEERLLKVDLIMARAFAGLSGIFEISSGLSYGKTTYLLLKGKTLNEEIKEAAVRFSFEYQQFPSITGDGFILLAENVNLKNTSNQLNNQKL